MRPTILITCDFCKSVVERPLSVYNRGLKRNQKGYFCSRPCVHQFNCVERNCSQCSKKIKRSNSQAAKFANSFCSQSCAATYNNTHKTKGIRRSKLEKYLEEQLALLFPNLEIQFNHKKAICSELDIYIPLLKLAIELNGVFHTQPIYGESKLRKIQDNDLVKKEACYIQLITLVSIDTSHQKQFTPESSKEYLNTIVEVIESKLSH